MTQPPDGPPPYGDPQYPPPGFYGYSGYPQPGAYTYGYPPTGYHGYPGPRRAKVSLPVTGWVLLACGLLGVIGSLAPWASVELFGLSRSVNGTDASDGKLTIFCAGVVAVMGVLIALRVGHLWTSIVGLVFAVFTALIAFADFGQINGNYGPLKDEHVPDGVVSVGYGIWLVIFGGVLGIAASIVAMVRRT